MTIESRHAAALFASVMPPSVAKLIQEDLLRDAPLNHVITVGSLGSFPLDGLAEATREAFETGEEKLLPAIRGPQARLKANVNGVILLLGNERVMLGPFAALSPNRDQRLAALRSARDMVGPFQPELSRLMAEASARAITNEELSVVLEAVNSSVPAIHARLSSSLQDGTVPMSLLFPWSPTYYDAFCGPDPGRNLVEEYLSPLSAFREQLIAGDLPIGLRIAAIGYSEDALAPGAWLPLADDDQLWSALPSARLDQDPFSVLATLDISMYRLHDTRFASLAASSVDRLCGATFISRAGHDVYPVLSRLFTAAKRMIALVPTLQDRPPFWRRMAALMQAIVIVRTLDELPGDVGAFVQGIEDSVPLAGGLLNLFDLQKEPFYHVAWESGGGLRSGILGLLAALEARHSAAGRRLPNAQLAREEIEKIGPLSQTGAPIILPGPLRGGERSPAAVNIQEDLSGADIGQLAIISFVCELSSDLLVAATKSLQQAAESARHEEGLGEQLRGLIVGAATLASTSRNIELADSVASALVHHGGRLTTQEVVVAVQLLVIASAALGPQKADEWLEEKLYGLARAVRYGDAASTLYRVLQQVKRVLPADREVTTRAAETAMAASDDPP